MSFVLKWSSNSWEWPRRNPDSSFQMISVWSSWTYFERNVTLFEKDVGTYNYSYIVFLKNHKKYIGIMKIYIYEIAESIFMNFVWKSLRGPQKNFTDDEFMKIFRENGILFVKEVTSWLHDVFPKRCWTYFRKNIWINIIWESSKFMGMTQKNSNDELMKIFRDKRHSLFHSRSGHLISKTKWFWWFSRNFDDFPEICIWFSA